MGGIGSLVEAGRILMDPVLPVLKPPEILLLINLYLIKFYRSGTKLLILLLHYV